MAGNKYICVDLGGTNLRVGLVEKDRVLKYSKNPTPKKKNDLLKLMVSMISEFMDDKVKAIGVGSPGPLIDGIIKNPPNLPLKNFNLQKYLENRFKKRVVVGNDADIVAMAESKYGVKKNNFLILTLGTGIGGGIIIDGRLFKGDGYGGELGSIIIDNSQTLETLWKKSREESKRIFGKSLTIKELLEKKDVRAKKILKDVSRHLGEGIASLINSFDPEVVVLMGGARETKNEFINLVRKEAEKKVILPKKVKIQWSKIKHPGILGSSLLVK